MIETNANENYLKIREALNDLAEAKQRLSDLNVIRSERLVGEIGEWFFTAIYGGKRAISSSQKGWDIELDDKKIQIKTHAKGDKNNARWTEIDEEKVKEFEELVIIVFTKEFYLKEFYKIQKEAIGNLLEQSGKIKVLKWEKLSHHKIELECLPNQKIIKIFASPVK